MPSEPVDPQITDSVSQVNVKVLSEAPAVAMGNIYQAAAQSMGMLYHNAVSGQEKLAITAEAATTQAIAVLYTLSTAVDGQSAAQVLREAGAPDPASETVDAGADRSKS